VPEPIVVEDDKLMAAIQRMVEQTGATLKDMANLEDMEIGLEDGGSPVSASIEDDTDVEDAPVVKYLQKLLTDAISAGASDIHFEPYERYFRVRYRVDGMLAEITQPPLAIKDKVASRIKVISRLDISEKRVPQDGRMKLVLSKSKTIDFACRRCPRSTARRSSCVSSMPAASSSASRRSATSLPSRKRCSSRSAARTG
jgi:type IV pilus assembly protein PilB